MPTMYHANGETVEARAEDVESWEESGWSLTPEDVETKPAKKAAKKSTKGDDSE